MVTIDRNSHLRKAREGSFPIKALANSFAQRSTTGFITRALLASGKVLFLDDPTSSMDMASEKLFVERLRTAVKPETTMIVTTHRNAVLRLVDRVVVIDQGRVVADGSAEAVLRRFGEGAPPPTQKAADAAPAAAKLIIDAATACEA